MTTDLFNLTREEAADRIREYAEEERLLQQEWHLNVDGVVYACAIGSIHPSISNPEDCPEWIMPLWISTVIPDLFDTIPALRMKEYGLRLSDALLDMKDDPLAESKFAICVLKRGLAMIRSQQKAADYADYADLSADEEEINRVETALVELVETLTTTPIDQITEIKKAILLDEATDTTAPCAIYNLYKGIMRAWLDGNVVRVFRTVISFDDMWSGVAAGLFDDLLEIMTGTDASARL